MKKALLTLVAVVTGFSVFGQGDVIFNNGAANTVKWDATAALGPGDRNPGSNLRAADGILVQLIWVRDAGLPTEALVPLGDPSGFSPTFAGRFFGGTQVTGTAATQAPGATFQIRAWDSAFATYDESPWKQTINNEVGGLVQFQSVTGDVPNNIPAVNLAGAIPVFTVGYVPEPSVFALGALGLGALLLLRRRK